MRSKTRPWVCGIAMSRSTTSSGSSRDRSTILSYRQIDRDEQRKRSEADGIQPALDVPSNPRTKALGRLHGPTRRNHQDARGSPWYVSPQKEVVRNWSLAHHKDTLHR